MKTIQYKKGYKYQLATQYSVKVKIIPNQNKNIKLLNFLKLNTDGMLVIEEGYAWDGASGPAIDTPTLMRGSLVHDALYQLMRHKLIDRLKYRKAADKELKKICLEDGMSKIGAEIVYMGVRLGARGAAKPSHKKKEITAPK